MQAFGSGSARREAVPRAGRACYSGASGKRLPRAAGRALVAACLIVAAPGLGGCAYRLDSLFRASSDDGRETTGSIPQVVKATPVAEPSGDPEADSDLAYARAAAATQMGDSAKGGAQPWENPRTGARGMVTALAAPYDDHGQKCRSFLASYVRGRAETWLQGEACEFSEGKWEVRTMRPWKRS